MQYKTIILALIQQRPELHEELRKSRKLLPALEMYAHELKTCHEEWKDTLTAARPGSNPSQIAGEAMEKALKDMEDHLPPVSQPDGTETLSLEEAVAFINSHTSRG
jgi:hypothetical protein